MRTLLNSLLCFTLLGFRLLYSPLSSPFTVWKVYVFKFKFNKKFRMVKNTNKKSFDNIFQKKVKKIKESFASLMST